MERRSDPRGQSLFDRNGEEVGTVQELYEDAQAQQWMWALVSTSLLGVDGRTMVPLPRAQESSRGLTVPYTKEQVKNAPPINSDDPLGPEDRSALVEYFGLNDPGQSSAAGAPAGSPPADDRGNDASNPGSATDGPASGGVPAGREVSRGDVADPSEKHITPGDLADFGGQLAAYGQQLAEYGQRLAAFAQRLGEMERARGDRQS